MSRMALKDISYVNIIEYKANGNWLKFYRCCWQVFLLLFLLQANGFECSDRQICILHKSTHPHTHIHSHTHTHQFLPCPQYSMLFIFCPTINTTFKHKLRHQTSQLIVQWTNSLNLTFIVTSYMLLLY